MSVNTCQVPGALKGVAERNVRSATLPPSRLTPAGQVTLEGCQHACEGSGVEGSVPPPTDKSLNHHSPWKGLLEWMVGLV